MAEIEHKKMQPSKQELRIALELCKALTPAQLYQRHVIRDLQRIRNRKTSWFGASENALRIEIDRFLRFKEK